MQLSEFEVAEDMLIGGLKIVQDKRLYRFTSDSVLLSRFARVKKGEKVADFCSGCGVVAFHLHALHPDLGLSFDLFEMQESLCALAKKTMELNSFTNFTVHEGRVQDIGTEYAGKFSLVLCNPPYERGGLESECYEKAVCRKELTLSLSELSRSVSRALKYGGRFCMVHRADRLAEICYTLKQVDLEVKKLQFVSGKLGDKPYLVLIEAVKGGKPAVEILPELINERREV